VLFGVAPFLFFPVAISVNDQQDKNNEAGDNENDDDGFVTPHIAYKIGNVRTHTFPIYTTFVECETDGKAPVALAAIVLMMAMTPSLKASTRFFSMRRI
jgi:hypothetical protein